MSRQALTRKLLIPLGVLAAAGSAALAQSVLAQLGLTEATARKYVLENMEDAGPGTAMATAARSAYGKLPPAARGPATTAFYAWTRTYVNSAAFKTAYAQRRTERMPVAIQEPGTVDQELKAKTDAQVKDLEETATLIRPSIPAADRATWEAELKGQIAQVRSPEMGQGQRQYIEKRRAETKAGYDLGMSQWKENLPADPMVRVARHLREFLGATGDVDFAAKGKMVPGEAGMFFSFDNPAYNKKPWQWRDCYDAGQDATAAARAAAQAWLKELATTSSTRQAFKVSYSATF